MYSRHSQSQQSLSLLTMINKPPKPPCWRDFVTEPTAPPTRSQRKSHSHMDFVDLGQSQNQRSSSDGEAVSTSRSRDLSHGHTAMLITTTTATTTTRSSSHHKKHKKHDRAGGRLHRTRSELNISQADLPEVQHMTINLADANPKDTLLFRSGRNFDAQIYLDDNAKRCEKWLEGVHASQPLTDIAFSQGSGDELEIPEENWQDLEQLKSSPVLVSTSASGSDIESVSVCGCGGSRNKMDSGGSASKSRTKNRRYSDTRVPQRTRDQGNRAQTLPTPGRLKKLARLAESDSQHGATTSGRVDEKASGGDRSKATEGRSKKSVQEAARTSSRPPQSKDAKDSVTRRVPRIERIPFKDKRRTWHVTEIDQNLLLQSDDFHKNASISVFATDPDLDRRMGANSFESLLDKNKPRTIGSMSIGSRRMKTSQSMQNISREDRTLSNHSCKVNIATNSTPDSTDLVSPRTSSTEVNKIDQIEISVDDDHGE